MTNLNATVYNLVEESLLGFKISMKNILSQNGRKISRKILSSINN